MLEDHHQIKGDIAMDDQTNDSLVLAVEEVLHAQSRDDAATSDGGGSGRSDNND